MSQCILPYILHMSNTHVLKADPPKWYRLGTLKQVGT